MKNSKCSININGLKINYEVKKYSRIRYIKLRMERELLVVTVPKSFTKALIEKFIFSKEEWIKEQLYKLESFKYTGLLYKGIVYDYIVRQGLKNDIFIEADKIIIEIKEKYAEEKIIVLIEKWYIEEAKKAIGESLKYFSELLGADYNKVAIKNQKTRWGSCSSNRNLNFNWRLIMAPSFVLDYIVVHELCHLIHMNHSREFWGEVKRIIPDYKKSEIWLKQNNLKMHVNYRELS